MIRYKAKNWEQLKRMQREMGISHIPTRKKPLEDGSYHFWVFSRDLKNVIR